jgi:hypothetical protein
VRVHASYSQGVDLLTPNLTCRDYINQDYFVMATEAQTGYLRKRDLPKPATILDNRPVVVEYTHANPLWMPPTVSYHIRVRAVDGGPIEPDAYLFRPTRAGLFPQDADAALTEDKDGHWDRR